MATKHIGQYRPFSLMDLQHEINRLFDTDIFGNGDVVSTAVGKFHADSDLVDKGDYYQLTVDVPGFKKNDFHIQVDNNIVTVSGERSSEEEQKEKGWVYRERSWGSFTRRFTVPEQLDDAKVKAKLEEGVLWVTLPKAKKSKGSKITIE